MNIYMIVEKTGRNMLRQAGELATETADPIITGCTVLAQGNDFREEDIDAQILHWDDAPAAVANGECPTPGPGVGPVLDDVVGILPIACGRMSNYSYCITKLATGRVDSSSVDENVEKMQALVHVGAKELRITGQDTGVYDQDNDDRELPELLNYTCTEVDGEFRVRVGTANPSGIHGIRDELAAILVRHDRLYNFIHAPVQSGSDEVLEHMCRQHRADKLRETVETFDHEPDYQTLSTNFIIDYPTETDTGHEWSMKLLRKVHSGKVNVTHLSKRSDTDAADLESLGGTLKRGHSKEVSEAKMDIVAVAYDEMVSTGRDAFVVEEGTSNSMKCRDETYHQIITQNTIEYDLEPGGSAYVMVTAHQTVYAFAEPIEAQPEPQRPTVT